MSRDVLLRAASGSEVGLGHVRRSRAVAHALREAGARPRLVVDDEASAALLEEEGFEANPVDGARGWEDRAAESAWLDGFRDWTPEILRLHARGTPCMLVENRTRARDLCQWLVYPSLHVRLDAWDAAHPERVLAGPAWIPLGPEILRLGEEPGAGARPSRARRDVDLVVTFGGSDPRRLTERVLRVLAGTGGLDGAAGEPARVRIAAGPHMEERRGELEALAAALPDAALVPEGEPLGPWLARSRVALTAVGTTLYELAYLGVPALVLANYAEDREALRYYAEHGPHLPLDVAAAIDDARLARELSAGFRRLRSAHRPRVPDLGDGAAGLASLLVGRRACLIAPGRRGGRA